MPSNKDLIAKIATLSPEATTEGLSNKDLEDLLGSLRGRTSEELEVAKAAARSAATAPVAVEGPEYYVAPRKALTSKRGILSGDDKAEVKAEYLAGGEEALAALVASGHIIKA